MSIQPSAPQPFERVLPTLNLDGTRRRLRPRPSSGRFTRARRLTAYGLMVVFFIIPYIRLGGRPLILLDLPRREFTLFGTTFLPTEMVLFMLLFVGSVILIFLVSALLGRAWCGWACPQTVYMEFLFRPVERLVEGGWRASRRFDRARGMHVRRIVKLAIYGALAVFLAHTFLAYFVGVDALAHWVRRSPIHHPVSFFVMAFTTALIFFDFAYFREQTCLVACPYGRLQSVMLDRRSLIVGYDTRRGEPRAKLSAHLESAGDCVDCRMCVETCPTGIDIREGLQMECIHCTQCMDACDSIMTRLGRRTGLIRYGSRDGFEGRASRMLRPRVVLYPAALAIVLAVFVVMLGGRDAEVTLLRGTGDPYTVETDGRIVNQIRVKVTNQTGHDHRYQITVADPDADVIAPVNPLPVAAGQTATTSLFVLLPPTDFAGGERPVTLRVSDGGRFGRTLSWRLVGPEAEP